MPFPSPLFLLSLLAHFQLWRTQKKKVSLHTARTLPCIESAIRTRGCGKARRLLRVKNVLFQTPLKNRLSSRCEDNHSKKGKMTRFGFKVEDLRGINRSSMVPIRKCARARRRNVCVKVATSDCGEQMWYLWPFSRQTHTHTLSHTHTETHTHSEFMWRQQRSWRWTYFSRRLQEYFGDFTLQEKKKFFFQLFTPSFSLLSALPLRLLFVFQDPELLNQISAGTKYETFPPPTPVFSFFFLPGTMSNTIWSK